MTDYRNRASWVTDNSVQIDHPCGDTFEHKGKVGHPCVLAKLHRGACEDDYGTRWNVPFLELYPLPRHYP